ncbi:MAG: nucleotidyltransferase domain-containing protein [Thermoproteota archaeon]
MERDKVLSRTGAIEVLRRLSTGEARFKELNEAVRNSRTLTKRLEELSAGGLIEKGGFGYRITEEGFDSLLRMVEIEEGVGQDLAKIRHRLLRISLKRLAELFLREFGVDLVSLVVYGSSVKDSFKPGESDVDLLYVVEDGCKGVWRREASVFRAFKSTWEYRACDYWFKRSGFYGYPEVTVALLRKGWAVKFQPVYLDMIFHRAILYDKEEFFQKLMESLRKALSDLGSMRVEHPDGTYFWLLKPDVAFGKPIMIRME